MDDTNTATTPGLPTEPADAPESVTHADEANMIPALLEEVEKLRHDEEFQTWLDESMKHHEWVLNRLAGDPE